MWQQITQDLEVVKGYQLELVQIPFQINQVTSVASSQRERQTIATEIQSLLAKGAITRAYPQTDQFTSRLFVIPKKDRSLRPEINLKPLNTFMANHHFKMEGISWVKELLKEGDWMCSVDLKDAYLLVAIAKQHRKYLRFVWEGITYEFTCLPFGLCSAPRIFTKLLRPAMPMESDLLGRHLNNGRRPESVTTTSPTNNHPSGVHSQQNEVSPRALSLEHVPEMQL